MFLKSLHLNHFDWQTAFQIFAMACGLMVAFSSFLKTSRNDTNSSNTSVENNQTLGEAISEAFRHKGYLMIHLGFFVCGFHVMFIATHLPSYLADKGLSAEVATGTGLCGRVQYLWFLLLGNDGRPVRQTLCYDRSVSGSQLMRNRFLVWLWHKKMFTRRFRDHRKHGSTNPLISFLCGKTSLIGGISASFMILSSFFNR